MWWVWRVNWFVVCKWWRLCLFVGFSDSCRLLIFCDCVNRSFFCDGGELDCVLNDVCGELMFCSGVFFMFFYWFIFFLMFMLYFLCVFFFGCDGFIGGGKLWIFCLVLVLKRDWNLDLMIFLICILYGVRILERLVNNCLIGIFGIVFIIFVIIMFIYWEIVFLFIVVNWLVLYVL